MTYANLFLPTWELGRFLLGNLDGFCLGTWTIFAWELGRFSLGNLDCFHLGTWPIIFHTTYWYTTKKETQCIASLQMVTNTLINRMRSFVSLRIFFLKFYRRIINIYASFICIFPISFIIATIPSASCSLSIDGDFSCSVMYGR